MTVSARFDVIIVGGGIAGLWTLALLRKRGFNAILLEQNCLGGEQSLCSQGIIHGGSKYALSGVISQATSNISQMPNVWQNALSGIGDVLLPDVTVLDNAQYLIPASGIDSKLLSFLGSKTMASFTESVKAKHLPPAYQQLGITKTCFKLNEFVLDTRSIFASFAKQFEQFIFKARVENTQLSTQHDEVWLNLPNITLICKRIVFAAGNGNAQLSDAAMQQRPLQMVMLKQQHLPLVYAHFIGRSNKPLLTITSHPSDEGVVWYMGGNLAEDGVTLSATQQINTTKQLLNKLIPQFALAPQHTLSTLSINRAEPRQSTLLRPDDAFVERHGNSIYGWPTKLALAPRFAQKVLDSLEIQPSFSTTTVTLPLANVAVGQFPWSSHD